MHTKNLQMLSVTQLFIFLERQKTVMTDRSWFPVHHAHWADRVLSDGRFMLKCAIDISKLV